MDFIRENNKHEKNVFIVVVTSPSEKHPKNQIFIEMESSMITKSCVSRFHVKFGFFEEEWRKPFQYRNFLKRQTLKKPSTLFEAYANKFTSSNYLSFEFLGEEGGRWRRLMHHFCGCPFLHVLKFDVKHAPQSRR